MQDILFCELFNKINDDFSVRRNHILLLDAYDITMDQKDKLSSREKQKEKLGDF